MQTPESRRPLSEWLADFKNDPIVEATGVSRESVGAWRSGRAFPRGKHLIRLCRFLRIDLAQVIDPEDRDEAAA